MAFKTFYDDEKHEIKYYDVYVIVNNHLKFMSGYVCGGLKRTKSTLTTTTPAVRVMPTSYTFI